MIIRPPSEAGSILLQVSLGCTHGKCAFCGAYLEKRFAIKDRERVHEDILFASRNYRDVRKVFLCDGDALSLPQKHLESVLRDVREHLPWVTRVGAYGNARGIKRKTGKELQRLKLLGFGMVYMGVESGDDATLSRMNKKSDAETLIREGRKVIEAGLKLNVTVINGLAGKERSLVHAQETARVLNEMRPQQIAALSLMLVPGTPLHQEWKAGTFSVLGPFEMLSELRNMLACIQLEKGLFLANHGSNYLPVKARLPRDRERTLKAIDAALSGSTRLRPEESRSL